MDDPKKFATFAEYHVFLYAMVLLLASECILWVLSARGSRHHKKNSSDNGTVCLIIFCFFCSLMAGAFFRSQNIPPFIQGLLLPHAVYYAGIILIGIGVVIRCAAAWTLKSAFTLSVQTADDQHLIQSGVYHYVRNPAYTGSILSLLGSALAYRHILGVITAASLCLFCYLIRISVEEKALQARFPSEFEQYCSHTRYRLFPGIL